MRAPPYLLSFESFKDYISALNAPEALKKGEILYKHIEDEINSLKKLNSQKLPLITSLHYLSVLFGISYTMMRSLYHNPDKYYRTFEIKKGKKKRKIEAPRIALKIFQKWIAEHLSHAITFNGCVHGFIPGKSYVTAAKQHLGAKWVYSLDITDFFQSTPIEKVKKAFIDLGYTDHGADIASRLCCYNKHLAQGSPASPVLSNLIFKNIDIEIKNLADSFSCIYTRYADDLVFSGKGLFPDELKIKAREIITQNGWTISDKKEHLAKAPSRLKVHGLLVHGEYVRLTKGYRNRIRAYKHLVNNNKIKESDLPKVLGHLVMAKHIEAEAPSKQT